MAFINNKQIYLRSQVSVDKIIKLDTGSWKTIKALVQAGAAAEHFSVGDILQCNHSRLGVLNWQILDIGARYAADGEHKNALTIGLKDPFGKYMFSAYQAFFFADSELPVGQYHFTLPAGYDEAHGGGKTYSFWLNKNKPLPEGGYLTFWWQEGQDASKVKIRLYAPLVGNEENFIDVVPVTEGSSGKPLTDYGEINGYIESCRIGFNQYQNSAIRQLLNSTETAGNVWTPQTQFDRPPDWATTADGFLNGIDEEFLSVIKPVSIDIHDTRNSHFTINTDKVYLLGWEEVNGIDRQLANPDGRTLEYFKGAEATDADYKKRVKTYADGTNAYWWLRSMNTATDSSEIAIVNANGSLNYIQPFNRNGVVPVCVIY